MPADPGPAAGAASAPAREAADRLLRQVCAGYLALQAVAGIVLWVLIAASDTVRSGFEVVDGTPEVTDAFFWADMVVVATSASAAWALWSSRSWAPVLVGMTLGGVAYPTALLVPYVNWTDGQAAPALGVMVVVTALTAWVTLLVVRLTRPAA